MAAAKGLAAPLARPSDAMAHGRWRAGSPNARSSGSDTEGEVINAMASTAAGLRCGLSWLPHYAGRLPTAPP